MFLMTKLLQRPRCFKIGAVTRYCVANETLIGKKTVGPRRCQKYSAKIVHTKTKFLARDVIAAVGYSLFRASLML